MLQTKFKKKTAEYAPVASSLAYSLGQPQLGALIGASAIKLNNFAGNAHNAITNAENSRNLLAQ